MRPTTSRRERMGRLSFETCCALRLACLDSYAATKVNSVTESRSRQPVYLCLRGAVAVRAPQRNPIVVSGIVRLCSVSPSTYIAHSVRMCREVMTLLSCAFVQRYIHLLSIQRLTMRLIEHRFMDQDLKSTKEVQGSSTESH